MSFVSCAQFVSFQPHLEVVYNLSHCPGDAIFCGIQGFAQILSLLLGVFSVLLGIFALLSVGFRQGRYVGFHCNFIFLLISREKLFFFLGGGVVFFFWRGTGDFCVFHFSAEISLRALVFLGVFDLPLHNFTFLALF